MLWKGSQHTTGMLRRGSLLFTALLTVVFAFTSNPVHAQTTGGLNSTDVQTVASQAGIDGGASLVQIIGNILNVFFGFLGVLLLCYLIYGGYLWMTATDSKGPEKAKEIIKNAIIGLIIIVSAFAITTFVMDWLGGAGSSDGTGAGGAPTGGVRGIGAGFPGSAGALGTGLIDYHIPDRDAREIPRNASIIVAFKQPIDPASAIAGYTEAASTTAHDLNTEAIHIFYTGRESTTSLRGTDVETYLTEDHKTLVLRPKALLGSATTSTDYSVHLLGGSSGLRLDAVGGVAGASIFSAGDGHMTSTDGYSWRFEVSTVVDNTPPKIVSVIPVRGATYAPNIVVQMNFDKPLNPLSASGLVRGGTGFQNIDISASPLTGTGSSHPDGTYTLSNQLRTVEFVTNVSCGVNSCGRQVYCLPFSSTIAVDIHAATLSAVPPQAQIIRSGSVGLYDGVVDYTGNSLDGNGDGTAKGPGLDNYQWSFQTDARPNLTPPAIRSVNPAVRASNVAIDVPVSADFSHVMEASTLTSDAILLRTNEPEELRDTFWWTIREISLRADGGVVGPGDRPDHSRVSITHRPFSSAQTTAEGVLSPEYAPFYTSAVQNIYQNCFNPASSASCAGTPYCCDERTSPTACRFPGALVPLPLTP